MKEQKFNITVRPLETELTKVAKDICSLLPLAISSLLLPTAFNAGTGGNDTPDMRISAISRATAVILLVVYVM